MKVEPGICLKTKVAMTKCLVKYTVFTRKSTKRAMIDKNGRDFLAKMRGFRRNSGRIDEQGGGHGYPARDCHGQDGHATRGGSGTLQRLRARHPLYKLPRLSIMYQKKIGLAMDSDNLEEIYNIENKPHDLIRMATWLKN